MNTDNRLPKDFFCQIHTHPDGTPIDCIRPKSEEPQPSGTGGRKAPMKEEPRTLPPVACTALLGDPFDSLSLDKIREVRNEAINHMDGSAFKMHGFTFLMPMALMRANSRLMMYRDPPNTKNMTII